MKVSIRGMKKRKPRGASEIKYHEIKKVITPSEIGKSKQMKTKL